MSQYYLAAAIENVAGINASLQMTIVVMGSFQEEGDNRTLHDAMEQMAEIPLPFEISVEDTNDEVAGDFIRVRCVDMHVAAILNEYYTRYVDPYCVEESIGPYMYVAANRSQKQVLRELGRYQVEKLYVSELGVEEPILCVTCG